MKKDNIFHTASGASAYEAPRADIQDIESEGIFCSSPGAAGAEGEEFEEGGTIPT